MLITEKFDESMILLANELCWPLEYVKSFKLNARKSSTKTKLSEQEQIILENWQQGDLLLYDHFKTIFEEKVCTKIIICKSIYSTILQYLEISLVFSLISTYLKENDSKIKKISKISSHFLL